MAELAEVSGKSIDEIKADVRKLAEEFQKNGDNIPLSYKKAYDKIGVYSEKAEKKIKQSSDEAKEEVKDDADEMGKSHKKNSEKASNSWKKTFSVLGNVGTAGLKVLGVATTAAVTGLTALGTAAVNTFADYEQLVGGVETLFGAGGQSLGEYAASVGTSITEIKAEYDSLQNAQAEVLDNASKAYKTAGLSANDYMETVTSFAAALKQSTASELEAAEAADQAIIDMSDNANKMGTSMESIQNAYQGFAKQNYTMLDNLKLGYGGTKDEMKRLLADATALTGIEYDLDSLSDVYEAIHVIQTELGITGTTTKEASTTISGSANAMKAAWENLLVGVADDTQDLDALVESFVDSAVTVAENLIPRIGTAIKGSFNLVTQLVPVIAEQLPGLVDGLIPQLLESGIGIVTWLVEGMQENVPTLIEKGYELLQNLVEGFVEGIPEYLPLVLDFVQQMGDSLSEKVPIFIQKGFELLSRLADGIVSAIPILVEKVPTIISTFANIINDNFPTILLKGAEIVWKLISGIISAIPTIIANIPQIISAIVDTIMAFQWLNLGKNIIDFFVNGIKNMMGIVKGAGESVLNTIKTAIQNLPEMLMNFGKNGVTSLANGIKGLLSFVKRATTTIFNGIINTFTSLPGKMLSIGKDLITGLWNGITSKTDWLLGKIGEFGSGILDKVKGVFDVNSPSKEFEYIGKMCVAGYEKGVEEFEDTPLTMTRNVKASLGAMKHNINGGSYAGVPKGVGNVYQTVYVNKEVSTADELARAMRLEARWGMVRSVPVG